MHILGHVAARAEWDHACGYFNAYSIDSYGQTFHYMHAQVRVVCSANGHFIKQASGHYEYEGGDTRLVGISSASSLPSLKEALSRVVTKAGGGSASASGSPEVTELHPHVTVFRCMGGQRCCSAKVGIRPSL